MELQASTLQWCIHMDIQATLECLPSMLTCTHTISMVAIQCMGAWVGAAIPTAKDVVWTNSSNTSTDTMLYAIVEGQAPVRLKMLRVRPTHSPMPKRMSKVMKTMRLQKWGNDRKLLVSSGTRLGQRPRSSTDRLALIHRSQWCSHNKWSTPLRLEDISKSVKHNKL